jgi:hypothetical protein
MKIVKFPNHTSFWQSILTDDMSPMELLHVIDRKMTVIDRLAKVAQQQYDIYPEFDDLSESAKNEWWSLVTVILREWVDISLEQECRE